MKYIEILGGIITYMSNEENHILEKFRNDKIKYKEDLTEREEIHVNNLIKRGILERQKDNDGIFFIEKDYLGDLNVE